MTTTSVPEPLSPARQEELLELVDPLLEKLRQVRVPLLHDHRAIAATSIPASCLGNAVTFLQRERDLNRFRKFLDHIDDLDSMVSQNQKNPMAQHRVLGQVLRAWLDRHPELGAKESLYVLAWVRRLLPKNSTQVERNEKRGREGTNRGRNHRKRYASEEPPAAKPMEEPFRGGQFAAAWQRARGKPKKESS